MWAKHEQDRVWHRVVDLDLRSSVVTACRGRWSTAGSNYSVRTDPPEAEQCRACQVEGEQ